MILSKNKTKNKENSDEVMVYDGILLFGTYQKLKRDVGISFVENSEIIPYAHRDLTNTNTTAIHTTQLCFYP